MGNRTVTLGEHRIEILLRGDAFLGLGRIWIGQTLVRSGRLPLCLYTASFAGHELAGLTLLGVKESRKKVTVRLEARFRPLETKLMRDHSFDPIHELGDWDTDEPSGKATIDMVFQPAKDSFNGVGFSGISYHYEYKSKDTPVFYLLEKSSWELGGDIEGATVYNQSACSKPVETMKKETFWTTEGTLFFLDEASVVNRCMTHNLPRWADHQWFDFQWKDDAILLGVFDHVDLIRTVLQRDPGKAELKCFDKHIFDEALGYKTSPKAILLNDQPVASAVGVQNIWTWIYDETAQRARDEFGLEEEPPIPFMGQHHWTNYTIDTYYKDIVPACAAVGIKAIFAENFKKSDASEAQRLPNGNMCCSQEYEIAESKGGTKKFKEYIQRCRKHGIKNYMWTNTYVSLAAELNAAQRDERSWFMAMEDTRLKYGGAYTMVSSNLDLKNPAARAYWIDAHRAICKETGLEGYFIDSHYNLFFMPVNYKSGHPATSWRESLLVMKEIQDEGVHWQIESFGPFGQNVHGHPDTYDPSCMFICYYVGLGNNYVTVPVPGVESNKNSCHDAAFLYYTLAHKVPAKMPLYVEDKRIDEVYGEEHRRALREYHELLPQMHRRYLQEDGKSVLYHNDKKTAATLWNFEDREVALPGKVRDLTTGKDLAPSKTYRLEARHTYAISGAPLPTTV